jgi:hypothetical protein
MRHSAIIILMIVNIGLMQAQDMDDFRSDKAHIFSLRTGITKYVEKDDAMSPFIYRGSALPMEISYRFLGTKSRQVFYANFDNLRLSPSIPNYENAGLSHYVRSTNIQIGYSYMRNSFSLPKCHCNLYLGCEISSLLNLRHHAYIYNNEFVMLDQFNSLGFTAQLEKQFANKKRGAFLGIEIPVVSYVLMGNTYNYYVGEKTDPLINYNGNVLSYLAKNGNFVSFDKLVYYKTDFSFIQLIGKHIGIEGKYSFRYYRFSQFQNLNYSKNLQSIFSLGLIGKL